MKEHRLAIFDLDGTLLDTAQGIHDAVRYTIEHFSLPKLSEAELNSFIGPPVQNSFSRFYGIQGEELKEITRFFRDRYSTEDLFKAVPYDGIFEALKSLRERDISVAVATYKREDYAKKLLKKFEFDRYAQFIFGADNDNKLKKSDIIRLCLESAGLEANDAIMIGDSDNDAIGANNLGIDFVAVTYGFGFHSAKDAAAFHPFACVDRPRDIPKVI